MKNKSSGFTYIECIVSLSIIITLTSLIYSSLYESFNLTNKNSQYNKMLNETKRILYDTKYLVSEGLYEEIPEYYESIDKENYTIKTKLEKLEKYYECYKIEVEAVTESSNIKLVSYVTK